MTFRSTPLVYSRSTVHAGELGPRGIIIIVILSNSNKNPILLSQLLSGPSLPRGPSSPACTVCLLLSQTQT